MRCRNIRKGQKNEMLVARSQAEIRLGLGLARPAASWGLQLAVEKWRHWQLPETPRRAGLHRAMETPTAVGSRFAHVAVWWVSGCTAVRPGLIRRACGWRWLPRLCCGYQVPLFQRPAWRGCCQPRAVFDLQQRIWCVHFTLGPDWPPKAPIALLPEATPKPGALRACMHHCRLRKLLAYTRR